MLKFFGSGSGFSDEHTSAYFVTSENELVVIDCPYSAFRKLINKPLLEYKDIYVLITHTHGDHIGGLGLFAQYAYFTLKRCISIVAPSVEVAQDIKTILTIEGSDFYGILTAHDIKHKEWFGRAILTEHSLPLKGKCFGYQLCVNGKNCVYTGDTVTLEPFMPYLKPGTHLYVDVSVHYGMVHLKLEDAIPVFMELVMNKVGISLMHLDDPWMACRILDENYFTAQDVEVIFPHNCE